MQFPISSKTKSAAYHAFEIKKQVI